MSRLGEVATLHSTAKRKPNMKDLRVVCTPSVRGVNRGGSKDMTFFKPTVLESGQQETTGGRSSVKTLPCKSFKLV